jgi:MSHA biogenesis protein MshQ
MILPDPLACPTCGIGSFVPGTWGAGSPSGTIVTSTATYADVGSFAFSLEDRTFAKVDQGDSTKSQRYIDSGATTVGRFVPDHFDTVVSNACGSFTYSGQVFPLTITARNGTGSTTVNYDGSYVGGLAKQLTLSDANGSVGTFGPSNPLAASAFGGGVANLTTVPSVNYSFTTKTTAPAAVKVRGGDVDTLAQTPAGGAAVESSIALRSGRLRLSNAFGSGQFPLPMTAQVEYYNNSVWQLNSNDNCTTFSTLAGPPSALTLSPSGTTTPRCGDSTCNPISTGVLCNSAATNVTNGRIGLCLSAPTTQGYVDVPFAPPTYLQFNGVSNPSARASFGIYNQGGNSRKIIDRREIR